ncbi:MAG: hypothetical protein IJ412_02435 [Oscillospiraceae bacterium]|nr:hypothetical protein [Oscillospiraceae bacterium]
MNTIKFDRKQSSVRMVAHRGVSGLETENTCAAFVAAGNRSHYGVETDVHVSADGQFIIHHDDNTLRVGGEDHIIEQTDAAVLRAITLIDRASGEKSRADLVIPLLDEYIRICQKYEKVCVLELKNHMEPAAVSGIVEVIRNLDWLENTIFISFNHANMVELRRLLPDAKLQFLTDDACDEALLEKLLPWKLDLDIAWHSLTKEGIDLMHANGIEVNCWTVDDPAVAEKLAGWGVDYITSNILE